VAEPAVVGPEVVAPGADAVGLVDGKGHQGTGFDAILQQLAGTLHLKPFRGQIEEAKASLLQGAPERPLFVKGQASMETSGGNAPPLQLTHLILHQGHERGHHHGEPLSHQRRKLIAKRLTRPRGKDGETVTAL
jgi:hypothetical protein